MCARIMRTTSLLTFCCWFATVASAYMLPTKSYPKLEVSGNNTLSLNINNVDGSQSYYRDDNTERDRVFTSTSNLYLNGEIYKDLFLNATMLANRYAPNNFTWNMRYDGNDARVLLGDFTANLVGNEYVQLNRSIQGVQVETKLPRGSLMLVRSELKSPVRSDTFYGENISGPYYLKASPIVDGSEIVLVNNVRKERMRDYTLNYTSGILNFSAGIIIGPSDRVDVSYELSVNGVSGGVLYAVRAMYPLKHLQIGVNHLQVNGRGQGDTVQSQRDQFLANGTPGPYYLTYHPIASASEIITFNGILQQNTELIQIYTLDYTTGRLLFTSGHEPPMNTTVIVRYGVTIPGSNNGKHSVTGLDLNWMASDGLTFGLQAAQSRDPAESAAGTSALSLHSTYVQRGLTLSTRYRQVGAGFSPLQMVGYRNVDRDLSWSCRYAPLDWMTVTGSGNNARQPLNPYAATSSGITMNERNRAFSLNLHKMHWPSLSLQHTTVNAAQVGAELLGNTNTTDSLTLGLTRAEFTASLAFSRITTDSRQLMDLSNPSASIFRYQGTTHNSVLNLQYQPNDRLTVGANLAGNRIEMQNTQNTDTATRGRNAQLTASYRAGEKVSFNTTFSTSKTGAVESVTGSTISAQKNDTVTWGANWQPAERLNLGLNYARDLAEGGDFSNSKSDTLSANIGWQPHKQISCNSFWSRQQLRYLTESGNSVSNLLGMNSDIGGLGKVRIKLDMQYLWGETAFGVSQLMQAEGVKHRTVPVSVEPQTVGAIATSNRLITATARVSYPIARKQEMFIAGDTTRNSGFPSKSRKNAFGLGWNYLLNDNLTFTIDAGRVYYSDDTNSSLNYKANQFNAQLSWHF